MPALIVKDLARRMKAQGPKHLASPSQSRSFTSSCPRTKTEKTTTSAILPTPPPSNVPAIWYSSAFWLYFFEVYTRRKLYARPVSNQNDFASGPEAERRRKKLATYAVIYNWLCLPDAVRDAYRRQRDSMPRNWRDSDPNTGVFKMAELRKFLEIVLDKTTEFPKFGVLGNSDFLEAKPEDRLRELDQLMKRIVSQAELLELTHSTELSSALSDPFRASQAQDTSLAAIFGFIHGNIRAADPKPAKDPLSPEISHVRLDSKGSAPSSSTASTDNRPQQKFTSYSKCLEWHADNPLYSLPSARAEDSLRVQLGRKWLKERQFRSSIPIDSPLRQRNRIQLDLSSLDSSSTQGDHQVRSFSGCSEGDAIQSGPAETPRRAQQYFSFRSREEDGNSPSAATNVPHDILRPSKKASPSSTSRLSPECNFQILAQSEHITLPPIRNAVQRKKKEILLPSIQHVLRLSMQHENSSPGVCASHSDIHMQDGRGNYWSAEHLLSTQIVQNSPSTSGSPKLANAPTASLSNLSDLAYFTSEPKQSYNAEYRPLLPIPSLPRIRPRLPPPPVPGSITGVVTPSLSTVTTGYSLKRSSESSTEVTAGSQRSRSDFQLNSGPDFSSLRLELLDSDSDTDSRDIIFERHRPKIIPPERSVQDGTSLALNPCASKGKWNASIYDRVPYVTEREDEAEAEPSRKRRKRFEDLSYVRDIEQTTVSPSRSEPDQLEVVASRRFPNINDVHHLLPVTYSDNDEASHKISSIRSLYMYSLTSINLDAEFQLEGPNQLYRNSNSV